MAKSITEYPLFGTDRELVMPVHDLVVELHDSYCSNEVVQEVLWMTGNNVDRRVSSFFDIIGPGHLRNVTALCIQYLDMTIEKVTRPEVISVSLPLSGCTDVAFTAGGMPIKKSEAIQRAWFEESDIAFKVRDYERTLKQAWDEFNLQLVLGQTYRAARTPVLADGEAGKLHQRIVDICENRMPQASHALDSAYYNAATRYFRSASQHWETLNASEFGRFFILRPEEIKEGVSRVKRSSQE
jgi:hypothetical protein